MLGSRLPSLTQPVALPEENESSGEIIMGANCVSLRRTSSNSGSLTSCQGTSQSLTPGDRPPLAGEVGSWQVNGEAKVVRSSTRVRKVQSESDLCNLRGSSASARVAANTLLCNDKCTNPSSGGGKEAISKVRKTWAKPLSRHRSLSSIPSVCFGASGLDRQDFIPEEVESASPTSEEGESRASVFDQIGLPNIEETALHSVSADASLELVNQGSAPFPSRKVLEVIGGQVGVKERGTPARVVQACHAAAISAARQDRVARANRSSSLIAEREIDSHPSSRSSMQAGGRASEPKLLGRGGGDMESGGGGGVRPPAVTGKGGGGGGDGGGGSDVTDSYYQKMLKENPGHPLLLGNYAQYLAEAKLDHLKADEFYQRAILADPGDGELLGQYAKIIWDVHHDRERATSYFERAVQAAPDDSYVVAAYASFLWNSEEEEDVAEKTASDFSSLPTLIPAGPA